MQLHPYHQAIIDANRAANRPYFHQLSPAAARELLRAAIAAAPPPQNLPALASVEDREIDGAFGPIPVRIYDPLGTPWGTVVFFHGGGWVIGDLDQVDTTCRRLAGLAQCRIVSVDYRLAPEHPYPAPLDDCWTALAWAQRSFPGGLIVAGESAGGNLAAACAIRARDRGGPLLSGQVLVYPVTGHDFDTGSYRQIGAMNWLLSTADMRWFWDHYCPAGIDRTMPEISPLHVATTGGLAPALVIVGELDPLRDEGLAYARRLAEGGVAVVTRCDSGRRRGPGRCGALDAHAAGRARLRRKIHDRTVDSHGAGHGTGSNRAQSRPRPHRHGAGRRAHPKRARNARCDQRCPASVLGAVAQAFARGCSGPQSRRSSCRDECAVLCRDRRDRTAPDGRDR
jgi:acetyl esterase